MNKSTVVEIGSREGINPLNTKKRKGTISFQPRNSSKITCLQVTASRSGRMLSLSTRAFPADTALYAHCLGDSGHHVVPCHTTPCNERSNMFSVSTHIVAESSSGFLCMSPSCCSICESIIPLDCAKSESCKQRQQVPHSLLEMLQVI